MALRHVVTKGDPILRKKCRLVDEVTDRIKETLGDMVETMRAQDGAGIAAPQVGVLRRMFVAQPDRDSDVVYYMINPEIYETEGEQFGSEACLSVPGLTGDVVRPERIRIRALDIDGELKDYEFTGWEAVIMCHEYDHLEGILYIDKAENIRVPEDDEFEEYEEEE